MRNRKYRILAFTALALGISEIAVIILSWIGSALDVNIHTRNLLSSEGIRWFFGHFVENLDTPVLIWIVLLAIATGCFCSSGLYVALNALVHRNRLSFRERCGLWLVLVELVVYVCVNILLTAIPHAILLSVNGNLFPSSFSDCLIPIISFAVCLFSVSYGYMSGKFRGVADIYGSLTVGIRHAPSLFVFYILIMQLYFSIVFVLF